MGPKKRSFHTPRNAKSNQVIKNDKNTLETNEDASKKNDKSIESSLLIDSSNSENKKYSKRGVESNWNKYEEPLIDQHADSLRGNEFEAVLSNSCGSGSQLKLKDEKEWEEDCISMKDISLNFQDLIRAVKCIPFHERIGVRGVFDENHIKTFRSCAEKWRKCYNSELKYPNIESECVESPLVDPIINIIEEPNVLEESEEIPEVKAFVMQDKTENIINSLASNLTFKKAPEKKESEEKKSETSSDLDFLLSLNIPSKISTDNKVIESQKNANVDDWLNSILDD